jgi:dTDP-4-amino-4,6-dideoxygalactose transaminase
MWTVPLFELDFDQRESDAVQAVLDSQWLTMGQQIQSFESAFSQFLNHPVNSTAVSSCTAALHMALLALGVEPEDEVIIPALTFVADINVVKMIGAVPVLADSESLVDWNVSAQSISKVITSKTKAVIVVHFAGYPCVMDEIVSVCRERNIHLIEDVAHAPGATYHQTSCGRFGDIGCFSFFTNKNLSIGEGGMFVTSDDLLHEKAGYLRSHGMTSLTLDRHKGRAVSYDVVQAGLNYRMDEIRAAIGLIQLDKLIEGNANRGRLVAHYIQSLRDCSTIEIPFKHVIDDIDIQPAYHIFTVLLDIRCDRLKVIEAMKQDGIQTSIHYPSFRDFSAFKAIDFAATPIADEISSRVLTLPLFPTMTIKQVDMVVASLNNALNAEVR